MCTYCSATANISFVMSNYVSVVDTIYNKGGSVKAWIKQNVSRLQDGFIGLCTGFYFGLADISIIAVIVGTGAIMGIIAWIIGAKY